MEEEPDNSSEVSKSEEVASKESVAEDKVDSVPAETKPAEEVQNENKEELDEPKVVESKEKSQEQDPVEPMEVDSATSLTTATTIPPESESPKIGSAAIEAPAEVENAAAAEEIVTEKPAENIVVEPQEKELKISEEIKPNDKVISSDESKVAQIEDGSNNHFSKPEGYASAEQKESSGHCQTEPEPSAPNSDIVQTPQSCN